MAVYRVVNELGHIEAEYPVYSSAYTKAHELHLQGNFTGHYRVEQVEIVYHTAQRAKALEALAEQDGDTFT